MKWIFESKWGSTEPPLSPPLAMIEESAREEQSPRLIWMDKQADLAFAVCICIKAPDDRIWLKWEMAFK